MGKSLGESDGELPKRVFPESQESNHFQSEADCIIQQIRAGHVRANADKQGQFS